jgi:hypothetical protein
MIAFRRLSIGLTFPGCFRTAAIVQATTGNHTTPIAAWRQACTLQLPQAGKLTALTWQSRLSPSRGIRRAGRAVAIRLCFLGASFMLTAARLLLRAGLLRSGDMAAALHWSSRLIAAAMQLWRQRRSDERR